MGIFYIKVARHAITGGDHAHDPVIQILEGFRYNPATETAERELERYMLVNQKGLPYRKDEIAEVQHV